MTSAVTIAIRQDGIGVVYALFLMILVASCRKTNMRLWIFYTIFLSIFLIYQYMSVLGVPKGISPILCNGKSETKFVFCNSINLYRQDFIKTF